MATNNPTAAPAPVDFNGLSADQVEMVLRQIASDACTLASLTRSLVVTIGATPAADQLCAMVAIVERIGALADHASGADVVGDFHAWTMGPNFRTAAAVLASN